uniref:Solute carrier family 25 member 38b n=1 Tax=Hucho hucho TaxID=62062 RepID=A0A4W5RJD0_9TELE
MFYSQAKRSLPQEVSSSPYAPLGNFGCGVMAGVLASVVTQPADVVKTHIQVSPSHWTTKDAIRYIYTVSLNLNENIEYMINFLCVRYHSWSSNFSHSEGILIHEI